MSPRFSPQTQDLPWSQLGTTSVTDYTQESIRIYSHIFICILAWKLLALQLGANSLVFLNINLLILEQR